MGTDEQEPFWRAITRISIIVGTLGGIVGLVYGIVTLLFALFPTVKPPERPQTPSVVVSEPRVEPGKPSTGIPVSFNAQIEGHKGEPLQVVWSLFDPATNEFAHFSAPQAPHLGTWSESRQSAFQNRGSPTSGFTPKQQSERLDGKIIVPIDSSWEGRNLKLRIEIADAHGTVLSSGGETNFFVRHEQTDTDPYGPKYK
jgi:hypothetical protein